MDQNLRPSEGCWSVTEPVEAWGSLNGLPAPQHFTGTLVYIVSSGHSGSTMLNLLLNGHSKILGLSEIDRIGESIKQSTPEHNPLRLPFWREVQACYESISGESFAHIDIRLPRHDHLNTEQFTRWASTNSLLFSCIASVSGVPMLVDASKQATRLAMLYKTDLRSQIKVIHLIRDGRAVVNSYHRKYNQGTFVEAFSNWAVSLVYACRLRPKFGKEAWLQMRYEDLTTRSEAVLQDICCFLGVEYESQMLRFRDHLYVGVMGNRMAREGSDQIVLDDRWKQELPRSYRILFGIFGTLLNKYHGY